MDLGTRQGRREQGRRIQVAVEEAGLSLAEVAQRIGCSRALIYQYVSGQVLAQPDRLQAIAQLCGRSLAWFYAEEGETLPAVERDAELARLRAELDAERLAFERSRSRELVGHLQLLADAYEGPPDLEALRRTCERLVERTSDLGDPAQVAEAELRLGNACYALGDYDAARSALARAVDGFRGLGLEDRERAARQTLGAALAGLGERDRALAEFEAALAGGSFSHQWRARLGRADVFEALGRGDEALAELAAAEELIASQAESPERGWAELYVAAATVNVYLLHDDFPLAVERARACLPLAEELACVAQLVEARLNVGYGRLRLGQWGEALESFDDALRLARLTGDRERAAVAMACRAELLAVLGRHDEARVGGKDALAAALAMGSARGEIFAHLALSEAYRRSANGHEALYHGQQATAAAAGRGLIKLEAVARISVARARRALGEDGPAAAEERRAGTIAEAIGARWVTGPVALGQARDALRGGRPEEALTQLRLAERMAAETGAWELGFEAGVLATEALPGEDGLQRLESAVKALLERRDRLVSQGVEEALLEEPERLTAVRRCVTLLRGAGRHEAAAELLEWAAWPPLSMESDDQLRE